MPDFLQYVGKLLENPKKKKESLIAAAAVLVLEAKMMEVEMAEKKKKRRKYWAKVLVKLIALEGKIIPKLCLSILNQV